MYNTYNQQSNLKDGDITWIWCPFCMARTDHVFKDGQLLCLSHNNIYVENTPEFIFANL